MSRPLTDDQKIEARLTRVEKFLRMALVQCSFCNGTGAYQPFNSLRPNCCEFCDGLGTIATSIPGDTP